MSLAGTYPPIIGVTEIWARAELATMASAIVVERRARSCFICEFSWCEATGPSGRFDSHATIPRRLPEVRGGSLGSLSQEPGQVYVTVITPSIQSFDGCCCIPATLAVSIRRELDVSN